MPGSYDIKDGYNGCPTTVIVSVADTSTINTSGDQTSILGS
jgi:hypothetical protein